MNAWRWTRGLLPDDGLRRPIAAMTSSIADVALRAVERDADVGIVAASRGRLHVDRRFDVEEIGGTCESLTSPIAYWSSRL